MFTPDLLATAVQRSTSSVVNFEGELFEELFEIYMNDSNSSTLREHITAEIAGCDPIPGKLGRDCVDRETKEEKEVKPKNYTSKASNGSGCFNDYTRLRYLKDIAVDLPIIQSYFVYGKLQYVLEYRFKTIAPVLDKQITKKCEHDGQKYVRSCSWTYKDYIDDPNLIVHYIDKELIEGNQAPKQFKIVTPFYKKLMAL